MAIWILLSVEIKAQVILLIGLKRGVKTGILLFSLLLQPLHRNNPVKSIQHKEMPLKGKQDPSKVLTKAAKKQALTFTCYSQADHSPNLDFSLVPSNIASDLSEKEEGQISAEDH